ncbi:MAG: protein kinase domain-containing protein [Thermoplasmatota archaeon]
MTYLSDPGAIIAVISGAVVALLGLLLLASRPWRAAPASFGLFALLWGLQVVAANMAQMASDVETATPWAYAFTALLIPLYLPLFYFAAHYPTPDRILSQRPVLLGVLALPALLLGLLMAAAPQLFIQGVDLNPDGLPRLLTGPLHRPLQVVNVVLTFVVALVVILVRLLREQREMARQRLALVVAAFLLYVSYKAGEAIMLGVAGRHLANVRSWEDVLFWGAGAAALVVALVAAAIAVAVRRLPWRDLLVASAIVPLLLAVGEWFLVDAGLWGFRTVGLWRLAATGLLVYGITRFRVFDLELRLGRAVPVAAYLGLAGLVATALWQTAGEALRAQPWLGVTAGIAAAAFAVPALRLGRVVLHQAAPRLHHSGYVYRRKLDVYRAALEDATARGMGNQTEQRFLTELRRDLGISDREHRVLQALGAAGSGDMELREGTLLAGRYKVEAPLAEGCQGVVHLAIDQQGGDRVVLKELRASWQGSEEATRRLEREVHLLQALEHPHLVQLLDALRNGGSPILVLEHLPGGDLRRRLQRGALPLPDALEMADQLLDALGALHAANVVHRDVKPDNLLFDSRGRVKLADLGIATDEDSGGTKLTELGKQPGTIAYMSPEQARGDRVDGRSDLYSAGLVLYEALAGRPARDTRGLSDFQARELAQSRPTLPLPDVPEAVNDVLQQALALDREARYPDATAFRRALEATLRQATQWNDHALTQAPEGTRMAA